jgi:hypothetical protein
MVKITDCKFRCEFLILRKKPRQYRCISEKLPEKHTIRDDAVNGRRIQRVEVCPEGYIGD